MRQNQMLFFSLLSRKLDLADPLPPHSEKFHLSIFEPFPNTKIIDFRGQDSS